MRSFRVGSLFGIPIKLDLTFLLVLPLFAYLIGTQLPTTAGLLNSVVGTQIDVEALQVGYTEWAVGLTAALGLFAGVVLHELGHSLTAMRYGYKIDSITLWIFGGGASLSEMPEDWKQEFMIAIAGPLVSVALGGAFYAGVLVLPGGGPALSAAQFVVGYLAMLNIALAVFNMLPGFPMDGGRVLRALLARGRPYARATQIAADVGKAFAILLGLFGLFVLGNVFMAGLALFIYVGASNEAQQTMLKAAFEDVTVGDLMTPTEDLSTVTPETSVADLVGRMIRERHTGYPVLDGGRLVGLVTLDDARQVNEVERDAFRVEEVMRTDFDAVTPETDAMTAIETMQRSGTGRLLVTDGPEDRLVGLISRSDLMTAFDIIQSSRQLKPREGVGRIGGEYGPTEPGK